MNGMHGEDWYRLIFDHIQDAITVIQAGGIVFANKPALQISGYSFAEYVKLTVWQLAAPQEQARLLHALDELKRQPDGYESEIDLRIKTRNGEEHLTRNRISILDVSDAQNPVWLLNSKDLGARADASQLLTPGGGNNDRQEEIPAAVERFLSAGGKLSTKEETLLRGVMDGNSDIIFVKDDEGRFILVNQAAADFYNTSVEAIIGKTDYDFHPSNMDDISAILEEDRFILEQKREYIIPEVQYCDARGNLAWYRLVKRLICDSSENKGYILGVMSDISDRKHLEEALARDQKLYEGGPVVVFRRFSDEPRSIEYVSPNISQFGYRAEEFTSGKYVIADIVHPDDWQEANLKTQRYRESGASFYEMEYRILCGDGSVRWVADYTYVTRAADGKILYYDWYILDISETKHVAELNRRQLRRLAALRDIDLSITSNMDLRKTLQVLLNQVAEQLNVDAASVLLYDKNSKTLSYTMNRGFHTPALRNTCLSLGEGNAGQAALQRKIVHIPDLTGEPNSLEHAAFLKKEGFVSYVGVPLIAKNQLKGVLEVFHRSRLEPDQDWKDFLNALAGQAAIAIDDSTLVKEIQEANINITLAYDATIEGWARALELRDMETEGHSQRVTDMTLILSVAMGIKGEDLVHIRRGALLHDVGKMGISDSILLKPGPLSEVEKKLIRRHPIFGYEMLRPIDFLKPAIDIVLYHHEKWDGTGYPKGLSGRQIPLPARLFAIIDVWDAVSHDRPYHKAWKKERVFDYIQEQSGIHFDPEITSTFLEILKKQKGF